MSFGKKIVSNIFYYSLSFTTTTFFGYLFWVIMGKFLVPEEYGILATMIALFYLISAFTTFGSTNVLPKFIPEFLEKKQKNKVNSIIRYSVRLVLALSILVALPMFIFSDKISFIFYGSYFMSIPLKYVSIFLFIGSTMLTFKATLQGLQKFKTMFLSDITASTIRIILAFILVWYGFQSTGGIVASIFWVSAFIVVSYKYILNSCKGLFSAFNKKVYYKFGATSMFSLLSMYFLQHGGVLFLGLLSTMKSAAMYSVTVTFGQIILFIPYILMGSLFPSFSSLWVKNKEKLKKLLKIAIKVITLTVLPLAILFSFFSITLLTYIFSVNYLAASSLFLGYMIACFFYGISLILLIIIYSIYRPGTRMSILLLGTIVNIALCLLLIPLFNAQGAVISFLIAQTLILTLSIYYILKLLKLKISKKAFFIIPLMILFFLAIFLVRYFDNLVLSIIYTVFIISLYLVSLFYLKIINKNDLIILKYLPDQMGFNSIKRFVKYMVELFDK